MTETPIFLDLSGGTSYDAPRYLWSLRCFAFFYCRCFSVWFCRYCDWYSNFYTQIGSSLNMWFYNTIWEDVPMTWISLSYTCCIKFFAYVIWLKNKQICAQSSLRPWCQQITRFCGLLMRYLYHNTLIILTLCRNCALKAPPGCVCDSNFYPCKFQIPTTLRFLV